MPQVGTNGNDPETYFNNSDPVIYALDGDDVIRFAGAPIPPLFGGEAFAPGYLARASLDQRPRNTLARNADPEPREHGIILVGMAVMLQLGREVTPSLLLPIKGRAFETGQEEGRENPGS